MSGVWDNGGVWGNATPPIAWANRPTNPAVGFKQPFSGINAANYAEMVWNGSLFVPASGGNLALVEVTTKIVIPPTGTMGNNGAYTAGTAFEKTLSEGCWMYFAANQIFSGSTAGFYWAVGSSATAFTVYQDTFTPGVSSPTPPISPTAWTGKTGPGSITGSTSEITLSAWNLPGTLIGKNGKHTAQYFIAANNSAGGKVFKQYLDTAFLGVGITITSTRTNGISSTWWNRNSYSAQESSPYQGDYGGASQPIDGNQPANAAIDTSVDKLVKLTGRLSTATDWLMLVSHFVTITPAG